MHACVTHLAPLGWVPHYPRMPVHDTMRTRPDVRKKTLARDMEQSTAENRREVAVQERPCAYTPEKRLSA